MYDLLEHKRLLARALSLSLRFEIGAVALAAYRWERRVLVDTFVSEQLWPRRRILPGGLVACAWAKITFVEGMCDVVCSQTLRWPGIRLNVHVDDITASCVGLRRSDVVCALSETMAEVGALVDIEIRGLVALPKCFVTCSDRRLAASVRSATGARAGEVQHEAVVLGPAKRRPSAWLVSRSG